jgi:glycosyltransferase involved in cell wall biosynthesis
MHICLISDEFLKENPLGGIGSYTHQALKFFENSDQKVTVITFGKRQRSKKISTDSSLIVLRSGQIPYLSLILDPLLVLISVIKLNKENKVDIVEAPEWRALSFFFAIFRLLFNSSLPYLVVRLHSPLVLGRLYNNEGLTVIDRFRDLMESFTVRHCNAVSCPSKKLALWAMREWKLKKAIAVIPNFVEVSNYNKEVAHDEENIVLFMGSLAVLKGFGVFLDALPRLLKETTATFNVVGRKSSFYNLNLKLEKALSRSNRIKYLGFLEGGKKNKAIEQSEIVVIPSFWENFPMICLEAMASSKIVVASKVGGLEDIIIDGFNGFLVAPGDPVILTSAIKRTLSLDSEQKYSIKVNAKETVKSKFSSSVAGQKMLKFYFSVLENRLSASKELIFVY